MKRGTAVATDDVVYVAPRYSFDVYSFRLEDCSWEKLPPCPHRDIGLGIVDKELVAMGGYDNSEILSHKVLTLKQESGKQEWVEELPSLNSPRRFPAVVTVNRYVLCVGGCIEDKDCTTVELLYLDRKHTLSTYWSFLTPVPSQHGSPSVALCSGVLYVINEKDNSFSCSLCHLLEEDTNKPSLTLKWTCLPTLPCNWSTAASLCRQPVIVGGFESSSVFQLINGAWQFCGSLSSCRYDSLVATSSQSVMVVVGGSPDSVSHLVDICKAE